MFRTVWLLCNLSLDGELFLRDGKNAAFVKVYHLSLLQANVENITLGTHISCKLFLIWWNPNTLGTMSAFGFIEPQIQLV